MFTIYIAKATENFGLPATRPIYERAIEGTSLFMARHWTNS
jgi:pre-mRNA-splicing factor SYF1